MTQHLLEALVQQVSKAVSELRTTLELNQLDDAAEYLEKAARKAQASASQDALAPLYYLKAARVQMERQDNTKAIALLSEIVENYRRSPEYGDALKAKAYLESMSK